VDGLRFSVSLVDAVTPSAIHAASSLQKLRTSLASARSGLAGYQSQLRRANALGDVEGHRHYADLVSQSTRVVYDLAKATEASAGSAGAQTAALGELGVAFGALAGGAAIGTAALYAFVEATESLVSHALEVVGQNRLMAASFEALGAQGEGSGERTLAFVDDLATKLPQSREQLAGYARDFEALGVTDLGELRQQITATASAQAIMGDAGAAAYERLTRKINGAIEAHAGLKLEGKSLQALYKAGLNEGDVAGRLNVSVQTLNAQLKSGTVDAQAFGNALSESLVAKGRGPLAALSSTIGSLRLKGHEAFDHLFDGVDVAPLTNALQSVIWLFGQGTATGQTMKQGLTDTINVLVRGFATGIVRGELFFGRLEIGALQLGLSLRGVERVLVALFEHASNTLGLLGKIVSVPLAAFDAGSRLAHGAVGAARDAGAALSGGTYAPGQGAALGVDRAGISSRLQSAPANDNGGVVQRAASGEGFASVAPGEMILPRSQVSAVTRGDPVAAIRGRAGAESAQSGSNVIHIGQITVQGQGGVTDAKELTITGLSLALERMQLAGGR
jgi:hypothetical protein